MIRKLRAGMMPPAGRRASGADDAGRARDRRSRRVSIRPRRASPIPDGRTFQRLNRAEYARSIRDLLGLDVDATAFLPPDTKSENFDNIADVQGCRRRCSRAYLRAATQISRLAVGDPDASPQLDDLQGAAHRVADRTRRRCAVRHARRHLGDAHVPGRRRIRLPHDAALDSDRAAVRQHRHAASRSRSRSTASASRSSTSTAA